MIILLQRHSRLLASPAIDCQWMKVETGARNGLLAKSIIVLD